MHCSIHQTIVSWPAARQARGSNLCPDPIEDSVRQQLGFSSGSRRFFAGFSLFIINFAGRISEAPIGGPGREGGAQHPVLHVKEPKKTNVRSARERTRGQNTLEPNKSKFSSSLDL